MRHEFCGSELRKRATAAVSFLGQAGGVHVDARAREQRVTGRPRREGGRGRATGAGVSMDGRGRYAGLGRLLRLPKQHSAATASLLRRAAHQALTAPTNRARACARARAARARCVADR